MKKLLALALVAVIATGAMAQTSEDNMMGVFFSPVEFVDATTNLDTPPATPFMAYIVLLNSTVETVGAYECSIAIDSMVAPFLLSVTGPNGWTNFGDNFNHLAGFQTPLMAGDGVVLSTVQMMIMADETLFINLGPADPPSIPGVPVIANGANPDELLACNLTNDGGYVATINGDGVVATEAHSLSSVKALFN